MDFIKVMLKICEKRKVERETENEETFKYNLEHFDEWLEREIEKVIAEERGNGYES